MEASRGRVERLSKLCTCRSVPWLLSSRTMSSTWLIALLAKVCRKLKTRKSRCFASTTQFMRMTSRVPSWCSKFVSWRQTRRLSFTSTTGHQASTSLRRIKTSLRKRWLFRKAQTRFKFSGTMIWSIFHPKKAISSSTRTTVIQFCSKLHSSTSLSPSFVLEKQKQSFWTMEIVVSFWMQNQGKRNTFCSSLTNIISRKQLIRVKSCKFWCMKFMSSLYLKHASRYSIHRVVTFLRRKVCWIDSSTRLHA